MEATTAGSYGPGSKQPHPVTHNPFVRIAQDWRAEWRARGRYPPGPTRFSARNTYGIVHDPLPILLGLYAGARAGVHHRLFHGKQVWMLGPEANQYVLVSHPENFVWREGNFADLIPLLGDGLLTIDGDYHDRARRIMMPAFHREQIDAAVAAMVAETERATAAVADGAVVDVYEWMRDLAMRIAMRALLGLDPDDDGHGDAAAHHFELALAFYGTEAHQRVRRDRRSAWRRMRCARGGLDEIVFAEIDRRRARPTSAGHPLAAAGGSRRGRLAADRPGGPRPGDDADVRRARHLDLDGDLPALRAGPQPRTPATGSRRRSTRCSAGGRRRAERLHRDLPYLEMVMDETLRLYPPGLDRAAPARCDVRVRRPRGPGRRLRQLLLVGQPPPARGLPGARGVPAASASSASARRPCRAAPTCPSAAARGSASASASARPR